MANLPLVVLIGDSIRMGYQDHVVSQLAGRAEVWAPEPNGGDSRNVLAHLDQWALARQPNLVHVNCGLHDLKRAFGAESEVSLAEYERNVRQILQRLQRELNGAVVWATTTPVVFAVVQREGKARLLTQDGVHFTTEGSQLLGRAVAECIWGHLSDR